MTERTWDRIEEARERWNVLRHPFYRRWSAGELSREELARYSGQYRHAVRGDRRGLSEAAARAAPERPSCGAMPTRNATTSRSGTASSRRREGASPTRPTPETERRACVVWSGGRPARTCLRPAW